MKHSLNSSINSKDDLEPDRQPLTFVESSIGGNHDLGNTGSQTFGKEFGRTHH